MTTVSVRHNLHLCSEEARIDHRVATNRKSQVVPDLDIRWKKGGPHLKGGPYEVEKRWPSAATR